MALKDWVLGKRIATAEERGQRVGPVAGVGVLGLDALASASYGPEALLTVLLPLGTYALSHLSVLIAAIIVLLTIVAASYRQTISAYPNGGGAYTVTKENLGENTSLLAAAALALDYILNASVAVSAGVGALVSALPQLFPHTLPLCLGVLLLLTVLNLRGVRTTGAAFLLPTSVFVACLFTVIAIGAYKVLTQGAHPAPLVAPVAVPAAVTTASLWVFLRAFASGCTAMTGVEAVSNGVPIFKDPPQRAARRTLSLIVGILMILLAGIAFLCRAYDVTATPPGQEGYRSVLSQVIAATVGQGWFYYLTIGSVIAVLALSANTSFADFPRVCRLLAEDRYLPEPFMHRGRRLAFSQGILVLSVLAGALLIAFGGVTEGLIPLFAVGALSAFTLSQLGMVGHWRRQRTRGATRSLVLNSVGAAATGATLVIVLVSKFEEGAWISVLLAGTMLLLFKRVRRHKDFVARATATDVQLELATSPPICVVPLRGWNPLSARALQFALGMTPTVIALQVLGGDRKVEDLSLRWRELTAPVRASGLSGPELVVLRSEYRQVLRPMVDFVLQLSHGDPSRELIVVVPDSIERRWYHALLPSHAAAVLRAMLLFRGGPQIVVVSIAWRLCARIPEDRRLRRSDRTPLNAAAHRQSPASADAAR